jgi:thiol-disulfide isomerase/thioredoxin
MMSGTSIPHRMAMPRTYKLAETLDCDRRCFLGAAMAMAGVPFGIFATAEAQSRDSREFAAIGRATEWLNSSRLTPDSLTGKVVLVDFWTYTCINWLRTLPYVRAWSQKYRDRLVVVGVHTPEFPFEHNVANVRGAVQRMKIEYPVVIDSGYAIWRAFSNQYWPALYFIDARGKIRDHRFGEGDYDGSEKVIQRLLAEAGVSGVANGLVAVEGNGLEAPADWASLKSPENYLGYERTQNFASPGGSDRNRRRVYAVPNRLALNEWALAGEWTMGQPAAVLTSPSGRIACRFHARDLHLVMGPQRQGHPVRFRVSIDGQAPSQARGLDVDAGGNGSVVDQRLYQLIRQPKPIVDRHFEVEFLDAGVEAFAFTFG